jgi:methyl-accepting chemotaxis protein
MAGIIDCRPARASAEQTGFWAAIRHRRNPDFTPKSWPGAAPGWTKEWCEKFRYSKEANRTRPGIPDWHAAGLRVAAPYEVTMHYKISTGTSLGLGFAALVATGIALDLSAAVLFPELPPGGRLAAKSVILGLAAAGLAWWLHARLVEPLAELRSVIDAVRADGDLSRLAPVSGEDEVSATAAAFNRMTANFRDIVAKLPFNAAEVRSATTQLTADAQAVASGAQNQREATEAMGSAVQALSDSIADIARHARETSVFAEQAHSLSTQGKSVVDAASSSISRIAESVFASAQAVHTLEERSTSIGRVVKAIKDIADQTNLLALNAAIEAARAGEQGRGFAVVADEVRKLAERTGEATGEIASTITAMQTETSSAVASIEACSAQAQAGAEQAQRAASSLAEISAGARGTLEKVKLIADAANHQSASAQEITRQVDTVRDAAEANHDTSRKTMTAVANLDALADNFNDVCVVFRLGDAGARASALHAGMPAVVRQAATDIGAALERAVAAGRIGLDQLFDRSYTEIPGTDPPKYKSRFDDLTDQLFPAIQEPLLEKLPHIAYAGAVDDHGYFPTHNLRFSQPLTGDRAVDFANNRTKRIFKDRVGQRCGAHEMPYLLQTYRRDTGEIMHDMSAPIYVQGRHWGGFRIGYRTE